MKGKTNNKESEIKFECIYPKNHSQEEIDAIGNKIYNIIKPYMEEL